MSVLLIGYNLRRPGQNYEELFTALRGLGNWVHSADDLDSTWIIETSAPANVAAVRDFLNQYIDANDRTIVIDITGAPWAGYLSQAFQQAVDGYIPSFARLY